MRLLDRYLFRELLTPLAFCLGGFLIFWISADAFNKLADFQDDKLRLPDIIEYYLVMTPEFLVTILPMVLLLALLYTLTNHARHNEITAMRAAGVSLWRMCVPYLHRGPGGQPGFVRAERMVCAAQCGSGGANPESLCAKTGADAKRKMNFAISASPMRAIIGPGSSPNIA